MGLKVYFDLMSQPSRAVILFLKTNNIPFTECPVALRSGEHLTEEYAKINPFHLVPVIDDDGFRLTESTAILRYLVARFNVPQHWYPKDLQHRAKIDEFCSWQHEALGANTSGILQHQIIEPREKNLPIDQERLRKFKMNLETTLDQVEKIFLKDTSYLCGEEITIADLHGICELMQPLAAGHDVSEGRPILKAWMDRVKNKLAPHFEPANKMVYKVRDIIGAHL